MAGFQRFNQATGGKTPQYLAAELRRSQLENEAINQQNAQQSSDIRGAIDLYDKGTGDNTPIMDGFSNMYDSMGQQGMAVEPAADMTLAGAADMQGDMGMAAGETFNPSAGLDTPMNLGAEAGFDFGATEDLSLHDSLEQQYDMYDSANFGDAEGMDNIGNLEADTSGLMAEVDMAADTAAMADTVESAEAVSGVMDGVESAAEATEVIDGVTNAADAMDAVSGVASNIGLGGVAGALTAESPEEAALTLAMNTNPYTAAALAAFNLLA